MPKVLLKVASGINLVIGGILLLIASLLLNIRFVGFFGIIIGGIALLRLGIGAIFLYTGIRSDEEIKKYKWLILTASIVSILTGHLISFILGLVAYSSIEDKFSSSPSYDPVYTGNNGRQIAKPIYNELTKEEKEQKRLRNLLALGTGLILLSGVIFATSSWNTLSDLGKVIALGVASIIFFFVSNLSETKLNLKASSVTYYILANCFVVVMFFAIGYFDLFGTWFSLNGAGGYLYISFLWLLAFGLIVLAYHKYTYKSLIYFAYSTILLFIISIWSFSEGALCISLFSLIFAIISLFRSGYIKELYSIGAVVMLIFTVLLSNEILSCVVNVITSILLLIVSLTNTKHNINNLRELIYGILLYSIGVAFYNILEPLNMLVLGLIGIVFAYLVLMILFKQNEIFRWMSIVFLLAPYISLLEDSNFSREIEYIFISVAFLSLIFSYTRGFLKTVDIKIVNIIEIVALSIWYIVTIFGRTTLEIAAFVGIVSFISILIGYKSEKWSSLYYTGIVFLVLNMVIQLREFWMSIPIWTYILVAGISLVGLVTYKEYFKTSKSDELESEVEKIEENTIVLEKQILDTRAIVTGSIVVAFFTLSLFEFII